MKQIRKVTTDIVWVLFKYLVFVTTKYLIKKINADQEQLTFNLKHGKEIFKKTIFKSMSHIFVGIN